MTAPPQAHTKPVKIGLLGPFGYGNLGDAAIQQSAIEGWKRQFPDAEFVGISLNPEDTERRHGIRSFRLNWMPNPHHPDGFVDTITLFLRKSRAGATVVKYFVRPIIEFFLWFESMNRVRHLDILVISGGGQLDDFWGGAFGHPYALWRWTTTASWFGTPVAFVSIGAGPIDSQLSRRFIRGAVSRASYISFRDEPSRSLVASLGPLRSDGIVPDLAHGIDLSPDSREEGDIIGVGPMGYADPRMWPQADARVYETYRNTVIELVRWLVQSGRRVLLFPGEADHDRWVIEEFLSHLGSLQGVEAPRINTVDELMSAIARTELVVASRFHGVLLAHAAGRPVLALAYHQKVETLMREAGQTEYCLDIRTFTIDDARRGFEKLWKRREAASAELTKRENAYRRQLDEQYSVLSRLVKAA